MRLTFEIERRRGMATVIVLILVGVMSMLLVANSRSLSQLQQHLNLLDQRQKQKFEAPVAEKLKLDHDKRTQ